MYRIILSFTCIFIAFTTQAQSDHKRLLGRWVGTYGNDAKQEPYYFSFEFLPDSTVVTYTAYNKVYGHGKYTLVKDTLSLVYRVDKDIMQYACSGILSDSTGVLSGSWRRISDVGTKYTYTQKGRWIMRRGK